MIRLSDLIGQDAIALGTATKNGNVKSLFIEGDRITAVELSHAIIPASAVRSFEGDVLTYDEHTVVTHGDRKGVDPRKMRLLDVNGDDVGVIADLAIDSTGRIDTIYTSNGETILGSRLRAIGSYAAVLGIDLPPPTGQPIA